MPNSRTETREGVAAKLAHATGISLEQARELVDVLGVDWSSLMREANLLKKQRSSHSNRPVIGATRL